MDSSNYSTNGTDYSHHTESQGQSMDQSEDSRGGRKAGERIYASKEQDDDKKLFVGGIAWETTPDKLQAYFSAFGKVVDCDIKKDQATKKPRGFAFVLFENASSVEKVLQTQEHRLDNKNIDPKPAKAIKKPEKKKKIFVGGIGTDLKDEQLLEYFSKFGNVVESEFPEDKSGKRLGFAFFTYETSDEAQDAQKSRFHTIGTKKVEVSEAVSKEERQQMKMRAGMGGMRPGRGRGGFGPGFKGGYGSYGGYEESGYYGNFGGGGGGSYGGGGYGGGGYGGGGYGGGGYGGGGQGYQAGPGYYPDYNQGYNQGGYNQGGGGGYGGYGDYSSGGGGGYGGGYGGGGGGGYGGYSGYGK
ncbi:heterogeneous nuclear ribonucleoprotein D-like isoform X2 [Lytechinus pictus]|uniref:heterogeneous nuclear ribonucleoprotein D-like isoform X2 n=1 Tax=Lytechinus pictus TaxID=7653 RepID=UPI00240DBFAD|nr:heterogeneous nuclear ribonucleoprotein D-like isoform X3 [Lytechinus pictus]